MSDSQPNTPSAAEEGTKSVAALSQSLFNNAIPLPTPGSGPAPWMKRRITVDSAAAPKDGTTTTSAPPTPRQLPPNLLNMPLPCMTPRASNADLHQNLNSTPSTPSGGETGQLGHFKKTSSRPTRHGRKPSSRIATFDDSQPEPPALSVDTTTTFNTTDLTSPVSAIPEDGTLAKKNEKEEKRKQKEAEKEAERLQKEAEKEEKRKQKEAEKEAERLQKEEKKRLKEEKKKHKDAADKHHDVESDGENDQDDDSSVKASSPTLSPAVGAAISTISPAISPAVGASKAPAPPVPASLLANLHKQQQKQAEEVINDEEKPSSEDVAPTTDTAAVAEATPEDATAVPATETTTDPLSPSTRPSLPTPPVFSPPGLPKLNITSPDDEDATTTTTTTTATTTTTDKQPPLTPMSPPALPPGALKQSTPGALPPVPPIAALSPSNALQPPPLSPSAASGAVPPLPPQFVRSTPTAASGASGVFGAVPPAVPPAVPAAATTPAAVPPAVPAAAVVTPPVPPAFPPPTPSAAISNTPPAFPPPTPAAALTTPPLPPVVPTAAPATSPTSSGLHVSASDSIAYKSMQLQVKNAKEHSGSSAYISDKDNLTHHIPTFFPEVAQLPPPIARHPDDVFLCGPVGASQKKEFKSRWGVLHRDRIDIYNKAVDTKPWLSWPLTGTTAQLTHEDDESYIVLSNGKQQLYLRSTPPTATNVPKLDKILVDSTPDLETMQRAWFLAIRARQENLQYIATCKAVDIHNFDERLLTLYDAQCKAPSVIHTTYAFATKELYQNIPHIPAKYIVQQGQDPVSKLPIEGFCIDLAGEVIPAMVLLKFEKLFQDPDATPIFGVKFGGVNLKADDLIILLNALASNHNSQLIQVDLSGVDAIERATDQSENLIAGLTRFLFSTHLTKVQRLFLKSNNLKDHFITALITSCMEKKSKLSIVMPLEIVDISKNHLTDISLISFIDLLSSFKSISDHISYLNISYNPFTDVALHYIAKWLTLPRPTSLQYTLQQNDVAPYKPINISHLYIQGSLCSDKGFIDLAGSLLWHVHLTVLDLSSCNKLGDAGIAALTRMLQINESLEVVKFAQIKLNHQALTALRLFYRYGMAAQNPDLFGNQTFSLVGLASEYTPQ